MTISADQFWAQCIRRLEGRLTDQELNTWMRPLQPRLSGRRLLLLAPNRTVMERVRNNWLPEIQRALHQGGEPDLTADIVVGSASAAAITATESVATSPSDQPDTRPPMQTSPLRPHLTFANYIEGKTNQRARAAAQHVADSLGTYNPLFIYAGSGLGKTHLMHAIGNAIVASQPRARVALIGAEQWLNQFVAAIRSNRQDAFKHHYRNLDLLLLDDVHFLVGKQSTQEELFHTFNALVDGRRQVVLTSDRFPAELDGLDDKLKSRFSSGLTVSIEPPDQETRIAILQAKARQMNLDLPDEVALFIAQRLRNQVRQLEGALNTLSASVLFTREPVTIDVARAALKGMVAAYDQVLTIDRIMTKVAEHYAIRVADLGSKARSRSLARPRQVAMALAKELTQHSLPEIGRAFGKDHTTVMHACKKVRELRDGDAQVREAYDALLKKLQF